MENIPENLFAPSEAEIRVAEEDEARRKAEVESNKRFKEEVDGEEIKIEENLPFFSEAEIRVAEEKEARRNAENAEKRVE